jgi:penicillin-binding protein A
MCAFERGVLGMNPRYRLIAAWVGAVIGLVLLGVGLVIDTMSVWRLQLLTGLWLLSLLPRVLLDRSRSPLSRSMGRLGLVFGLGLAAVGMQLTREQVSQAEAVRQQAAALLQPATAEAPDTTAVRPGDRTALGNGRVWPVTTSTITRGAILARNGTVLAVTQGGRRVYPTPGFGQVIGYQSRLYGTTGIERSFDSYLSGARTRSAQTILEARLLGTERQTGPAADVRLTLDTTLQQVATTALGDKPGAVVLLDPQTGAILALATYPRFDPNQLVLADQATQADVDKVQAAYAELTARPDSPLLNRATQGRYPPGSVIKTLTGAAALDAGVVNGPDGQVTCPNRLITENGAPPVRNAVENLSGRTGDPSDLRRVFAWSCNTAFAQLGLALGPERFADYAARFGLRAADAVSVTADLHDIPADAGSIASNGDFLKRPVALADTAFGQGQALVTPLDMAQMVAVIANGGRLMRPYLVQEAKAGGQVLYLAKPEVLRQVIGPQAAQQMRSVMQTSVEIGYARAVALPGVTIGAKTGTAETSTDLPHSWFVAIAPVEQPRFAIAVITEHSGEGSRSALPIARQVLAAALGVQP